MIKICGVVTEAVTDWSSKRQGAVSHSTTEAEIIAADRAVREHSIPISMLWELFLRPVQVVLKEDNQATLKIIQTGYSKRVHHTRKC